VSLADGTSRGRLDRDSSERFVGLRQQLDVSAFGLNQMNLAPGQRGRIHRHKAQEEAYLVLDGELTVLVEGGEEHTLGVDDAIRVAPGLKRQLVNKGSQKVTFLAVGGAHEHQSRDGEAFEDWDQAEGSPPQEVPLPKDLELGG
jgi:uncharacterized cupin superfamily protein